MAFDCRLKKRVSRTFHHRKRKRENDSPQIPCRLLRVSFTPSCLVCRPRKAPGDDARTRDLDRALDAEEDERARLGVEAEHNGDGALGGAVEDGEDGDTEGEALQANKLRIWSRWRWGWGRGKHGRRERQEGLAKQRRVRRYLNAGRRDGGRKQIRSVTDMPF